MKQGCMRSVAFCGANGFPAATYEPVMEGLRQRGFSVAGQYSQPRIVHIFVAHAWPSRTSLYQARLALSLSIRLNRALIRIGHDCYPAMLPSLEAGRKNWRDMRDMLVRSVEHQAQQTSGMYMLLQAIHHITKIAETFILV